MWMQTLGEVRAGVKSAEGNMHCSQTVALPDFGSLPEICLIEKMVLGTGLEPARLTAHAPQTCVSTNSTTRALFD
jgi:hypothetical protein